MHLHLFFHDPNDDIFYLIAFHFSTAISYAQLEHLVQACQPATFGIQQQDVLDESYRKAWKMDAMNFATNFNPNNTGIIQVIHDLLLKDSQSSTQVELHKLNVYGTQTILHLDLAFTYSYYDCRPWVVLQCSCRYS